MSFRLEEVCINIVDCEHKTAPIQAVGIPSIRTTDIKNGRINFDKANRVSEETYIEWTQRLEPRESDLILTREAPVGEIGIIPKNKKLCLGQRTVLIRVNQEIINPLYLLYLLIEPNMKHQILSKSDGSVVSHLNIKAIKNLTLPCLPKIDEQYNVAKILSTLDEKIEVNKQINKTLEKMAQAIFKQWFVDFEFPNEAGEPYQSSGGEMVESELGLVPKGWEIGSLGDILTLNYGKSLPAKNRLEGNVKVYSSAGITGLHNEALIHEPSISIIIGRKGTIGTIYYSTEPAFCIDTAYYATQTDSKYPLMLMYQFLKEINLKQYNEDSAVPGLNRNTVYAIKIVIPPSEMQNKINVQISAVYNLIFKNMKQNEKLIAIRDLLLPKLMTGEIRLKKP